MHPQIFSAVVTRKPVRGITCAIVFAASVGAVAPPVQASAGASGPGGAATATAQVNPGAAAAEAAREALPAASLPPGDVGASVVRGAVELGASTAGRCALTLVTDPAAQDAAGAQVFLELVRLLGSLQHRGADPMARERARAAAQARAEEDARRRQAAADEESRRRQAS